MALAEALLVTAAFVAASPSTPRASAEATSADVAAVGPASVDAAPDGALASIFPSVLPPGALALDHVSTELDASVSDDLERVVVSVRSRWTPAVAVDRATIVLGADRTASVPRGLDGSKERELFPGRIDLGGFTRVAIVIDGARCTPDVITLDDGARALACPLGATRPAGAPIELAIEGELDVPERYGPIGRRHGALTLAAGWYPYVARLGAAPPRGPHVVRVEMPAAHAAIVGRRYFSAPASGPDVTRRTLDVTDGDTAQVPLFVLPPSAGATPVDDARVLFVSRSGARIKDPEQRTEEEVQILFAITDALRFLREEGLPLPTADAPLVVVEAKLRHELARATDGPVVVSDRAFRILPGERFFRFHRLPLLRELFTAHAIALLEARLAPEARALLPFTADAIGAWLVDRYVRARFGAAENAFDVLGAFSFIPAIDTMLYAPDLPFVEAYFRAIIEDDPLLPNLIDFPSPLPRGKILYEKLLDRLGRPGTDGVLHALVAAVPLRAALDGALGADAADFAATWIAPYPSVRYSLGAHGVEPAPADLCGGKTPCFVARAEITRDGDPVAEPLSVRFEDDEGYVVIARGAPSKDVRRVVTATVSAPLSLVELDPAHRLGEVPTADDPSPRYDNRDPKRWKILLNNFYAQLLASESQVDTAIDVGIERAYDVRWSHAVRVDYEPAAIGLSARASYGFGEPVTPARMSTFAGAMLEGAYLRPGFGHGAGCAGLEDERAFALSAALSLGYDDRGTAWAPDAGRAGRAALEYSHVFGSRAECSQGVVREVSRDALALVVKGVEEWRFGGAHRLSVRAKAGLMLAGDPREQLLFRAGGRTNVRGYRSDALQGRVQAILSGEWLHTLAGELDEDFLHFTWVQGLDGALFADVATVTDGLGTLGEAPLLADVGYGVRLYIDYFGVRPGVMAIDVALPLFDAQGRADVGSPAVYIDFTQSFLLF
ncbi:BamA/TamA family outer membrane protein [Myxococcota bacterium]|nr:BamA/TamA family outer membrane protein [Myxococcota bacterium]